MDRCMFRNNIHRLSEIQEESQFTLQNSYENTQNNFHNKHTKFRIKSNHNNRSSRIVQNQQIQEDEDDKFRIVEIGLPNQNALKRPNLKRNKQQTYDEVKNAIIRNIYCSNKSENFFKQYIQAQQQQQMGVNQIQNQANNNMQSNSPVQIQISNPQERQTSLSSYQYTASTSASTTQNSYSSKKQQMMQNYYTPSYNTILNTKSGYSDCLNNSSFNNSKSNNSNNRNSPGQTFLNSQKIIKLIQNDGQEIQGIPKRIERKIKYIEKFSSATVYMGKQGTKQNNIPNSQNSTKQIRYLPPVKNIVNRSIDNLESIKANTQPNLNQSLLNNIQNQQINCDIPIQLDLNKQIDRFPSTGKSKNSTKLDKPLLDYKEDELNEFLTKSQKQKSIFKKQQQQLEQYNILQRQILQLSPVGKENRSQYISPKNKCTTNMNKTISGNMNQLDKSALNRTSTNLDKIEVKNPKLNKELQLERENNQYICQPPLSKQQFIQFLQDKQQKIDEKINSLQHTDEQKIKELKYLLEKQKGNQQQSQTSLSFYKVKENKSEIQRTHSSNEHHKKSRTENINFMNQKKGQNQSFQSNVAFINNTQAFPQIQNNSNLSDFINQNVSDYQEKKLINSPETENNQ
ncbi:hypothetical protein ABPG74_004638 [Tetrahymena malaccensis]